MYVIKLFENWWVREVDQEVFHEIYDLEKATQYKTKKEAKAFLENITLSEYAEIVKYEDEIDKFLQWKEQGMIRRVLSMRKSKAYNGEGLKEVIQFHKNNYLDDMSVDYEDYKTWPKINNFMTYFYDIEAYHNKNEFEGLEFTFQIKVEKDCLFSQFKKEIKQLEKHVTYIDDDGYMVFPIFDKDLSQFGTRHFLYNPNEDKHKVEHFEGTLKQCFEHIKKHYYYE